MSGTLYLVGTPLGNLEDLSRRAVRILSEVDQILCEDTRRTGRLLSACGIEQRLRPFHDHNEDKLTESVIGDLKQGQTIALASDAGMPVLNDPGYKLVRAAIEQNIDITTVPGPSAPVVALVLSGFPPAPFAFFGFPPIKSGRRQVFSKKVLSWSDTAILFLSPHRGAEELDALSAIAPDRPAVLFRELTKKYEGALRGSLQQITMQVVDHPPKGEWTLVIGPEQPIVYDVDQLVEQVQQIAVLEGRQVKDVAFQIAEAHGLPRRSIYKKILETQKNNGH